MIPILFPCPLTGARRSLADGIGIRKNTTGIQRPLVLKKFIFESYLNLKNESFQQTGLEFDLLIRDLSLALDAGRLGMRPFRI